MCGFCRSSANLSSQPHEIVSPRLCASSVHEGSDPAAFPRHRVFTMSDTKVPGDECIIASARLTQRIIFATRISKSFSTRHHAHATQRSSACTIHQLLRPRVTTTHALQKMLPPLLKAIKGPSWSQKMFMTSAESWDRRQL